MRCPNITCKTTVNEVESPEIIYMRYDDENMKYLYICVECDAIWKTDDKK
jgi:DNA-directed RNA polymerase subunit M/transcription elongation factor TFIIS